MFWGQKFSESKVNECKYCNKCGWGDSWTWPIKVSVCFSRSLEGITNLGISSRLILPKAPRICLSLANKRPKNQEKKKARPEHLTCIFIVWGHGICLCMKGGNVGLPAFIWLALIIWLGGYSLSYCFKVKNNTLFINYSSAPLKH